MKEVQIIFLGTTREIQNVDDTSLGTLGLFDTSPIFDGLLSLLVVSISLFCSLLLLCVLRVLLVVVDQA